VAKSRYSSIDYPTVQNMIASLQKQHDILQQDVADIVSGEGGPEFPLVPINRFWGVGVLDNITTVAIAPAASPANDVCLYEFILPFDIVVNQVTTESQTARLASHYSIGLYDAVDGTLILDSGPISTAVVQVNVTTLGAPVELAKGIYVFAQTTDDILTRNTSMGHDDNQLPILNKAYRRRGLANNVSVAGQLPTTTGGIKAFINNRPITLTLFENTNS
jgi:hypothetical protein